MIWDERAVVGREGAPNGVHLGSIAPTRPAHPAATRWRRPGESENRHRVWAFDLWDEWPALLMNISLDFPYLVHRLAECSQRINPFFSMTWDPAKCRPISPAALSPAMPARCCCARSMPTSGYVRPWRTDFTPSATLRAWPICARKYCA